MTPAPLSACPRPRAPAGGGPVRGRLPRAAADPPAPARVTRARLGEPYRPPLYHTGCYHTL